MTAISRENRLRADAERNRQRVLQAAALVFSEHGSKATLNDVARAAGVGVATVYRKFEDKEAIFEVLFDEKLDSLVGLAATASRIEDAGEAFRSLLWGVIEARATDRGLDAILSSPGQGRRFVDELGRTFAPIADRLVLAAIQAGELRPDFTGREICLLGFMVGKLADITRPDHPEVWRRYAQLLIDGTRPSASSEPLSPAALSFSDVAAALSRSA